MDAINSNYMHWLQYIYDEFHWEACDAIISGRDQTRFDYSPHFDGICHVNRFN